nr:hypothetical protein [Cryptosporangium phraense]
MRSCGRIDVAGLHTALAGTPLPRAADGRIVLAAAGNDRGRRPGVLTAVQLRAVVDRLITAGH